MTRTTQDPASISSDAGLPTAGPNRRRQRATVAAGAAGAALVVWGIAAAAGTTPAVVRTGTATEVGPLAVVATALMAALAGWGLLALLERRTREAARPWTVLAVLTLLVSLSGPVTSDTELASKAALLLMHLAVGAVVILGLRRTT